MDIKIGIDLRCLMAGKKTGVEEYARRATEFLIEKNPDKKIIIFINSYKDSHPDLNWVKNRKNVEIKYFNFPNRLLNFSFWLLNWPKIDKLMEGIEVFFMPNIGFGAISKNCKLILTVHDLSFERFPEYFSFKRRLWHFLINPRKWCQRADQIWTVSKSTKEDLNALYKINNRKIRIFHFPFNGNKDKKEKITEKNIFRIINKYQLPEKYILFLGTIEPRKNIISVIKAFEELKKNNRHKELKLVIAGAKGWLWQKIQERFHTSQFKKDIIFTGFVEEDDKPALYYLSQVFIYPSFLEGFGYPPLEAMQAGTPVIASNCSSLPEIIRDCAVLVDPYQPFEISRALEEILNDVGLRDFYVKKGKEQAEKMNSKNFYMEK